MIGRIVCSAAGRDKKKFMVIVGQKDNGYFVCDGKERPLQRPKFKNCKHLKITDTVLETEQFNSNKKLRRALHEANDSTENPKEEY